MPTYYTGTDLDGIRLRGNDERWIVESANVVSNAGVAVDFGATMNNTLEVQGSVISHARDAVRAQGTAHIQIDESGQVQSGIYGGNDGISLDGWRSTIHNFGSIVGTRAGVSVLDSLSLRNEGQICGETYGVYVEKLYNYIHYLTNLGTISGGDAGLFRVSEVKNLGSIQGEIGIVHGENDGTILNFGVITGTSGIAIAGNDFSSDINLINRGVINGDAYLGSGDSLYVASRTGVIHGTVYGGIDEDTLVGNGRDDRLDGSTDDDLLRGRGGDDSLAGGMDNDTIYGGDGNDTIVGWEIEDPIYGNSGSDIFYGGRGNDVLGEIAEGRFDYGEHQTMSGGRGSDTFLFDVNLRASVTDFKDNVDTLVFSSEYASSIDALLASAVETVDGDVVFGPSSDVPRYVVSNTSKADLADDIVLV